MQTTGIEMPDATAGAAAAVARSSLAPQEMISDVRVHSILVRGNNCQRVSYHQYCSDYTRALSNSRLTV